jgi:hypothetical protein
MEHSDEPPHMYSDLSIQRKRQSSSRSDATICTRCQSLLDRPDEDIYLGTYRRDLTFHIGLAAEHCRLCKRLCQACEELGNQNPGLIQVILTFTKPNPTLEFRLNILYEDIRRNRAHVLFVRPLDTSRHITTASTGDPRALRIVDKWIEDCL